MSTYADKVTFQCQSCQPQCIMCSSLINCLKCYNTTSNYNSSTVMYFLIDGMCSLSCPNGTYMNTNLQQCFKCYYTCKTCFGANYYQCI